MHRMVCALAIGLALTAAAAGQSPGEVSRPGQPDQAGRPDQAGQPDRPNILMMMVDDLGFSDLGCYGGEIETPNLDSLAEGGLRFSQFYNTAKCHSSRVSLLTGQYCIAAGDESLGHGVTSAEVLRRGGYATLMTGKWHLRQEPTDFGFDRYFGHLSGACNYFTGDNTFRLDGQPWTVPPEGFYTTVANVDYGLKFLEQADRATDPWYLYIAFNAPHAPLQALPRDYAKYEGRYDAGWDDVRQRRLEKQAALGLLPAGTIASERPEHVPAWDALSQPRKQFEQKRMTALAGMIDRVDQEVGRVLAYLESTGQRDNTLIWLVSDNGACPYDRVSTRVDAIPTEGTVTWSDSTGWAWARNSPFRYYKQNQYEGGTATPAIVNWPAGLKTRPGAIVRQPAHLIDIMPTFADIAGCEIPTTFPGRDLRPVSGQSLRPIFDGGPIERAEPLHFLFAGDRAIRDGDWKAVSFKSQPWELYHLADDRTERTDLASAEPQRLAALVDQWHKMARDVLHARGRSVAAVSAEVAVHANREWTNFDADPTSGVHGGKKAGDSKSTASNRAIRARKNTKLEIQGKRIELTFAGDDPGLAFDSFAKELPTGPYRVAFDLESRAVGDGEIYFTTNERTSLPKGTRIPFSVNHDGGRHTHSITLDTDERLRKMRLDVSDGPGQATIRKLRIESAESGDVLMQWPH